MKTVKLISFLLINLLGISFLTAQTCNETGEGAYHTGVYKNMFEELLNKTEVNAKVNQAFNEIFYGSENQKLYYESQTDMAYILDVHNNDIRSEGMSYGMMICVQLDKQDEFDKLWKYTKTYMQHTSGDLDGFFKWQLNPDGSTIDNNPAPDGEAYFITSLFFAANRWGNGTGIFDYEAEAQIILEKVMNKTGQGGINNLFNSDSKLIIFGPNYGSYEYTDPSYNLPGFFELWARWSSTNQIFWNETPSASRELIRNASHPTSGLSADYSEFNGQPKETSFNQDSDRFMFDAWRTIMNLAMDYHWFQADEQQPIIGERYLNFFKNQGNGYPNHYDWDGSHANGEHSGGLVACNATAALVVDNPTLTTPFVQELWDMNTPSGTYRYYDGMLYMLALLNTSGNFKIWKPACEDACSTPTPTVTSIINYELGENASPLTANGINLLWYEEATGGTGTSNAPMPNTMIQGTKTYYVSQTTEDCESPRSKITVNVTYIYPIYNTITPPTIDGLKDETWNHDSIQSIEANYLLVGTRDVNDLSATAKFMWDDDYLYILAEVTDDVYQNDSENSYEDDAVEFYFDMNNEKSTTYDQNDFQYSFGWNDHGIVGTIPEDASTNEIVYLSNNTTNGYIIEIQIPWTTLAATPFNDQVIGLDFMVNDDDDMNERDSKLSWNAQEDQAWQNASLFGNAVLKSLNEPITSLDNSLLSNISIYPNPSVGVINVQGLENEFNYILLDFLGNQVLEGRSTSTINVNQLENGFYNLIINTKDYNKTLKIVISK